MINDEGEFTKNKRAIHVKPGTSIHIDITMQEVTSDASLESLAYSQRQCILPSEYPDGKYSKSECQLKCQVKIAEAKCGCLSWKYSALFSPETSKIVCGAELEDSCFQRYVNDAAQSCAQPAPKDAKDAQQVLDEGGCPTKCNMMTHTYSITRTFNEEDSFDQMCRSLVRQKKNPYVAHFLEFPDQPFQMFDQGQCLHLMKNTAVVTVAVVNEHVQVVTQTRRATFASQIAALGGIAGLFTGMSLISLAEVIYWMGRPLGDILLH